MKNRIVGIALLSAFMMIGFMACNNGKTAQEYLREEKKAIEKYIDRKGLKTDDIKNLSKYWADDRYKDVYFRTDDGLYINFLDTGNGRRVVANKDIVCVRFSYMYDVKSYVSGTDTLGYAPNYIYWPFTFQYGNQGSYTEQGKPVVLACDGWAIPLKYVGERAKVNLIIPSALGNSTDNTNYIPRFFSELQYTSFY